MIPHVPGRLAALAIVAVLVGVVSACGGSGASFDPSGPCTSDGRMAGAYPDLERQLPAEFDGRPANTVDSGRNCTVSALGTLASAGVSEIRFAGGVWEIGERSGVTLALFRAPKLDADMVADFYEAGARAGKNTEEVTRRTDTLGDTVIERVETLNDQSFQTIAVLHGEPGMVRVALVASDVRESAGRAAHEATVERAVAALAAGG